MCLDPVSLMVISTGLQAFGGIQQSNAEADFAERQASQLERDRQLENERVARQIELDKRDAKRVTGQQIANFSANGIQIDGSAVDVINDSANESDLDIDAIRFGNQIQNENSRFEQSQLRTKAGNVRRAGKLNAISTAIGGATRLQGAF